jgi:hypothetical protein
VIGVTNETNPHLVHTSRASSGSWASFRDVERETGDIGTPYDAALRTNAAGQTHVLAMNTGWNVFHAIRSSGGTWSQFGNVESAAGVIGDAFDFAMAEVGSDMHVLVSNQDWRLWHTIRFANGTWQTFNDVEGVAGEIGDISYVYASGSGGLLHVCAVANPNLRLYYAIRKDKGQWIQFAQMPGVTGRTLSVSCSVVSDTLHVLRVRETATGGTLLEHATRSASGIWSAWGNVNAATGSSLTFSQVSSSEVTPGGAPNGAPGELHVIASSATHLYHSVRGTNGGWTSFSDVNTLTNFTPGFINSNSD